jgi:hypothetical protein
MRWMRETPSPQTCAFDEIGRMLHPLIRVALSRI